MKRAYSTLPAEKLAFKYRDQVVAASGDSGSNSTLGNGTLEWSDVEEALNTMNLIIWNLCAS